MDATEHAAGGPRRAVWRRRLARDPPRCRGTGARRRDRGVRRRGPAPGAAASVAGRQALRGGPPAYEGWAKYNRHYWRARLPGFARWFFEADHVRAAFDEGDRRRRRVGARWLGRRDARRGASADLPDHGRPSRRSAGRVTCPMLIVHGTEDHCQPIARAHRLAELTGAPLVVVEGADHMIPGRHPVLANLLIRDFVRSLEEAGHDRGPSRSTLDPRAGAAGAQRACTSPPRSGSGHAHARRGDRRRAPRAPARTSRSTGWPSTRSRPCSRRAASGSTR